MFTKYKALKQTKAGPRSSGTPFLVIVKFVTIIPFETLHNKLCSDFIPGFGAETYRHTMGIKYLLDRIIVYTLYNNLS